MSYLNLQIAQTLQLIGIHADCLNEAAGEWALSPECTIDDWMQFAVLAEDFSEQWYYYHECSF